jgi:5-methyltetrahydrofolate--homocysteine methyltransferase
MNMTILEEIKDLVIKGNARKTKESVQKAVDEGLDISDILNQGLIAGMQYVGVKFKANEVYVPEVLMSARAMSQGTELLRPLIAKAGIKEKAVVVIGTVKGDLHDIGTNLVTMMLQGSGYKAINIGVDISGEKFAEAIEQHKPKIVGLSALLTSTMPEMQAIVAFLKPYRDKIKIMVGGAPVTKKFAEEIGADAYAEDAARAVDEADRLIA